MLRDLGDPGWGDPWFPHGAVLLPLPACMALCVSVFFPFFWLCLRPYRNEMTQCCHLLHEAATELVASHSFVVGFLVLLFGLFFVLFLVFVCLFAFVCFVC